MAAPTRSLTSNRTCSISFALPQDEGKSMNRYRLSQWVVCLITIAIVGVYTYNLTHPYLGFMVAFGVFATFMICDILLFPTLSLKRFFLKSAYHYFYASGFSLLVCVLKLHFFNSARPTPVENLRDWLSEMADLLSSSITFALLSIIVILGCLVAGFVSIAASAVVTAPTRVHGDPSRY